MMLRSCIFTSSGMSWAFRNLLVGFTPQRFCVQVNRSVIGVNNSEVLDHFIENLMTKKAIKWKLLNEASNKRNMEVPRIDNVSKVETLPDFTGSSVDDYIIKYIKSPQSGSMLNYFRDKGVSPSPEILQRAAYAFAKTGNKTGIETVISLADIGNYDEKKKQELKIFQAEAVWRSGGSIQTSLALLLEAYRSQPSLRRFVRSSLRTLIGEVIDRRGEASLVQVKNLVMQLANPPYEDAVPLSFLWGHCILSEWFADQQVSEELVTLGRDNPHFRRALQARLPAIVGLALKRHQVGAVYHVLEVLLRLSLHKPAENVLGSLFDYKYIMGDKKGCEAILELCAVTNLDIGTTRKKQFKNATVQCTNISRIVAHKNSTNLQDNTDIFPVPKFKFKL